MKIGLRIPGAAGQMPFSEFCAWCKNNGFEAIDIGQVTNEVVETATGAGLTIGTADLPGTRDLISLNSAKVKAGTEAAKSAISAAAENGISIMFCVFVPDDTSLGRA